MLIVEKQASQPVKTSPVHIVFDVLRGGNSQMKMKHYLRDSLLGALGAALMLVGDLCLSVIPASQSDSGLFLREAYLSGTYPAWRLPLLLATGVLGMALCCFAVRVCCVQIRPQYRRTRQAMRISGAIYLTSAGVIHLLIGSMANWTSVLSPLLGREETAALIQEQYGRLIPMLIPSYAAMDNDFGERLGGAGGEDHPAPADAPVPPAHLAAGVHADPRCAPGAGRGDHHLGFCAEPGLRQRGAADLDAEQCPVGGEAPRHRQLVF